jgi:hypothetical protein
MNVLIAFGLLAGLSTAAWYPLVEGAAHQAVGRVLVGANVLKGTKTASVVGLCSAS